MEATVRAIIVMAMILVVAQVGAIIMVSSVLGPEDQIFEDPNDPLIPVYYVGAIVGFTFLVLFIMKKRREDIVRVIFLFAVGFTIFFVLMSFLLAVGLDIMALLIAVALAALISYYLIKRPEWYVVDAAGILVSIGVVGLFGISLQILPVMILLIILAAYDAVSVYGTKHMVALADGVTKMRLPILIVVPKKRGYSYLRQKSLKEQIDEGEEREAMFMGLGDIIIPGILVASAFNFLPSESAFGLDGNLLVALGSLAGCVVGFAILMRFVLGGNPQAGLPLLNGGAIAGYLIAYLVAYGDLSFGITI
jgi:presenilin-like A22 family membrane protease